MKNDDGTPPTLSFAQKALVPPVLIGFVLGMSSLFAFFVGASFLYLGFGIVAVLGASAALLRLGRSDGRHQGPGSIGAKATLVLLFALAIAGLVANVAL